MLSSSGNLIDFARSVSRVAQGHAAIRLHVRTFEAEQMLKTIARQEDLSRTTLGSHQTFPKRHISFARRQGVLHTPNPMHDVEIPKCRPAGETYAYSLEEETQMLAILPEPAATVVATAAFTGARKGELRGLTWDNYDGSEIRVMKSVWRSYVDEPKRPKSKAAIPVITPLKVLLERHRARCGTFSAGSFSQMNNVNR
jgi:integrase